MTTTPEPPIAIADVLDRHAIRDVILRYCRGIDRLDLESVRSCYHPDATDDHGVGPRSIDEFLRWVEPILRRYTMTFHFVGNLLVEVAPSRTSARAETYGVAVHRGDPDDAKQNLVSGFRYVDTFERRDGGPWRIARRVCPTEWVGQDDPHRWWPTPSHLLHGRRDGTDVVYEPF